MQRMARCVSIVALIVVGLVVATAQWDPTLQTDGPNAEFHFVRVEYRNLPWVRGGRGRPWWMQDWPAAETHFARGIERLTHISLGDGVHLPLTDDRIFDFPWAYATQVGYWDLNEDEVARLREYLKRGGFLVVDDFYGPSAWEVFRESMQRVFPDRPIVDLPRDHAVMNVLYTLDYRTQIPGLRHLRPDWGGGFVGEPMGTPYWRGIFDEDGRLLVAINYNMDVGDAWEHADLAVYPEEMTALAYRFGINYILYAMTH